MSQTQPDDGAGQTAARVRNRRVKWFLFGGAVLVLAAISYREFWLARPIGMGPAGPQVAAEPFAEIWTERPVLLLGIGDSVTAGLGADSSDHSYFERLAHNPPDEFPELRELCLSKVLPNLSKQNEARSGSTSLTHLEIVRDLQTQDCR